MEPNIIAQEPIAPPEPEQQPIESNPLPTGKKSLPKWPLIIAGVILLATLLTGSLVLYKNMAVKPKPIAKTISPTATPTPDPTANWTTYSNDFFGISLKYPSEWTQLEHDTTPVGNSKHELTEVGKEDGITLTVELQENNNFKSSEDYLNFLAPVKSSEKIALQNNIPAYFYTQFNEGPMPKRGYWTYLMFWKDGKQYTLYIISPEKDGSREALMNSILSTFKFTDQTSQNEPVVTEGEAIVSGYYYQYDQTAWGETKKCDAFIVESGENEPIVKGLIQLVKEDNTVNRLTEDGKLIMNLNLTSVDEGSKNIILSSNSTNTVKITVKRIPPEGHEVPACTSFVTIESVN